MRTVVGLFESGKEARRTIDELAQMGFSPQNISVVTNLSTRSVIETGRESGAGLQTMSLSDVGTIAAAGPLRAALERPEERAGLAGVLQRLGLSSELATHYASGVERGETLGSVTVDDADADRVAAVMTRHAAGELRGELSESERAPKAAGGATMAGAAATAGAATMAGAAATAGAAKTAGAVTTGAIGRAVSSKIEPERIGEKGADGHLFAEEERTIPVYREELRVGKREVERGTVRVTTHVIEKPYAEQVTLREEHVDVERRPADRLVGAEEPEFKERQIEMSEIGEEAIGAKQTRLVEEVVIHKHVGGRTATVEDKLRSTQIDVSSFDPSLFRSHFDQLKGGGSTFEEQVPAYRFGHGFFRAGGTQRWEDVEADARTRWEKERPGTWDKYKESIRFAWSRGGKS